MHKLGSSPIGCEDFSTPHKWGIGIGSSRYRLWRLCAISERPRRSKTKLVLQSFCRLLIYIICIYIYIHILCKIQCSIICPIKVGILGNTLFENKPKYVLSPFYPHHMPIIFRQMVIWIGRNSRLLGKNLQETIVYPQIDRGFHGFLQIFPSTNSARATFCCEFPVLVVTSPFLRVLKSSFLCPIQAGVPKLRGWLI